jgi:hypothetical protein
MKRKDVIIIIGVAIVSAIFSYVLSNALLGGENTANLTAPKVTPISADFPQPDEKYFNENSLNPTKTITIGDSTNTQPF